MRPLLSFFVALTALAALSGCGTKTPLTLPPLAQPSVKNTMPPAPTTAADDSNKAAEPRQ